MSWVKKLEWEYREQQSMTYVVRRHWGIEYFINQSFGSDTYYFTTVNHEGRILYDGDDLPSAQAAAQADYEPRILSALTDEARAALSPQMAEACESTYKCWRERALKAEAENERLRGRVLRAEAALQPFADAAASYDPDEGDGAQVAWAHDFSIGALRQARAALAQEGK